MSDRPAQQPVLQTNRLVLRAPETRDLAVMRTLASAREVAEMTLNIPHPYPDGAAEKWFDERGEQWRDGTGVTFAITLPQAVAGHAPDSSQRSEEFIGAVGIAINIRHARGELGYWVGVPYWNRGYTTEASAAVMHWAFHTLKLNRIEAHHDTRNPASGRVMQKLGMQFEGIQREYTQRDGIYRDVATYAVLSHQPAEFRANNEIALHVADPVRAAEFYERVLNCTVVKRESDCIEVTNGVLRFFLLRDTLRSHEAVIPSFDVPDRTRALELLKAEGCTTVPAGPHAPGGAYVRDPFGILFEVIEPTKK